jgi:hypothetical protein
MRLFVILLLVVAASPALSQTLVQELIEAKKMECLNREVGRLMQPHNAYSLSLVADIAKDAAHICRGADLYDYALEQQAYEIVYNLMPTDQKSFLNKQLERMLERGTKQRSPGLDSRPR